MSGWKSRENQRKRGESRLSWRRGDNAGGPLADPEGTPTGRSSRYQDEWAICLPFPVPKCQGPLRQAQGRLGGTLSVVWRSHRDRGHPPSSKMWSCKCMRGRTWTSAVQRVWRPAPLSERHRIAGDKSPAYRAKGIPQGLKPGDFCGFFGTTEVVPFQNALRSRSATAGPSTPCAALRSLRMTAPFLKMTALFVIPTFVISTFVIRAFETPH